MLLGQGVGVGEAETKCSNACFITDLQGVQEPQEF